MCRDKDHLNDAQGAPEAPGYRSGLTYGDGYKRGLEDARGASQAAEERRCQKCDRETKGEEALVDGQIWCHPCADNVPQAAPMPTDEWCNAFLKASGQWVDPHEPATECGVEVECGISQDDADAFNAEGRNQIRKAYEVASNGRHDVPQAAVEGSLDTVVQLIHKHVGVRQRVNVDLTGIEDAAQAILAAIAPPQAAREALEEARKEIVRQHDKCRSDADAEPFEHLLAKIDRALSRPLQE